MVARIARARPEAVVVVETMLPRSGALLRQLRKALGPDVTLIVPDGFAGMRVAPQRNGFSTLTPS